MEKPHAYLVPGSKKFRLRDCRTRPPKNAPSEKKAKKELQALREELYELQRRLYADGRHAVLVVFQAMDAAGKDSTIRHVFRGVNPAGCVVHSFKKPSTAELTHDFLWRAQLAAPARGYISVFNRSHYEETLVVRVHPELLQHQKLLGLPTGAEGVPDARFWKARYASIRNWEEHLANNGTTIVKFFLNVSREAQAQRFLDRIDEPESNWKFNNGDLQERERWSDYMSAYEETLRATSCDHAPWFAVPADDKPYMRLTVARIVRDTLAKLPLSYPSVSPEERKLMKKAKKTLLDQLSKT